MLKEMEVKTNNPQIESIDSIGALDKFSGKSTSKNFRGWISGQIGKATKSNNLEVRGLLETIEKAYNHYHPKQIVQTNANQWQGKSSMSIIKKLDGITIIKYQRPDKDSEPHEVRTEISNEELSCVIASINYFSHAEQIETRDIARQFSKRILFYQKHYFKKRVFDACGDFIWDWFFANRVAHNKLTLVLHALCELGFIEYSGGKTKVINKNLSLQSILP